MLTLPPHIKKSLHLNVAFTALIAVSYSAFIYFGYDLTTPVTNKWRLQLNLSVLLPMILGGLLDFVMEVTQLRLIVKLKRDLERKVKIDEVGGKSGEGAKGGVVPRLSSSIRASKRFVDDLSLKGQGQGQRSERSLGSTTVSGKGSADVLSGKGRKIGSADLLSGKGTKTPSTNILKSSPSPSTPLPPPPTSPPPHHTPTYILSLLITEILCAISGVLIISILAFTKYCLIGHMLGQVVVKIFHIASLLYNQAIPQFVQDCVEAAQRSRLKTEVVGMVEGEVERGSGVSRDVLVGLGKEGGEA
ncbi:hypothetical protein HDV00_010215 [Rhizophlyctis rosea]|nr:hypothetical protein HDV00_010215 [Rhizophlyctis rosea]